MYLLDILPRRYTTLFNKLKSLTSKLHTNIIPTFVKVKEQFLNERDRWNSSEIILKSQLHKHKKVLSRLIKKHDNYREITNSVIFYKLLNNFVLKTLRKENTFHLSTKTRNCAISDQSNQVIITAKYRK